MIIIYNESNDRLNFVYYFIWFILHKKDKLKET